MNLIQWENLLKSKEESKLFTVEEAMRIIKRDLPEMFEEFEGLDLLLVIIEHTTHNLDYKGDE